MNFTEAQTYLFSLGHESLSIKLGLLNIAGLVDRLGSPHKCAPAVQIAGTNGKGSTAAMLSSICQAAGIRTGLYTSPHLVSITERIKINGAPITEDRFAKLATAVREAANDLITHEAIYSTFFEHITAIAFLAFRDAKVNLMILETGLGGRLDATTIAEAEIVAVMSVDFDHQEYLGTSLAEISAEKAAIIRVGTKAVIAPQREEAQREIEKQITDSNANASIHRSGRHRNEECRFLRAFYYRVQIARRRRTL
ncbi:MAG: Mur ligase family protein [Pyrinomonadaceae bacterium]